MLIRGVPHRIDRPLTSREAASLLNFDCALGALAAAIIGRQRERDNPEIRREPIRVTAEFVHQPSENASTHEKTGMNTAASEIGIDRMVKGDLLRPPSSVAWTGLFPISIGVEMFSSINIASSNHRSPRNKVQRHPSEMLSRL